VIKLDEIIRRTKMLTILLQLDQKIMKGK